MTAFTATSPRSRAADTRWPPSLTPANCTPRRRARAKQQVHRRFDALLRVLLHQLGTDGAIVAVPGLIGPHHLQRHHRLDVPGTVIATTVIMVNAALASVLAAPPRVAQNLLSFILRQ